MKWHRIKAIIWQELFITFRSLETVNDVFAIAVINFLLFGFLSLYLVGSNQSLTAQFLLMGMLLWEIVRIIQYSISVGILWNIWSRNLSNLFIAPLMMKEYILAHTITGILKGIFVFVIASSAAIYVFNFNIFAMNQAALLWICINMALFSFATGILFVGVILRFGTRVQALTWAIIPILQPLTAAFYPVTILPLPLQYIAYLFPITYAFEAGRVSLVDGSLPWQLLSIASAQNVVYGILCIALFFMLFTSAKKSGRFARNDA